MLVPVVLQANRKVTTSLTLTLESLAGANLPLMFPDVTIYNRTTTNNVVLVQGTRRVAYANQADADFNGVVSTALFPTLGISNNAFAKLPGLETCGLVPALYGITNELTLSNAGPAATAWVSILIRGLVEAAVLPDPALIVNV